MSMIFSEDKNYEEAREIFMRKCPLGISGSMAEDMFKEYWSDTHPVVIPKPEDKTD